MSARPRVLRVELDGCSSSLAGPGVYELALEVTGRPPVYISRLKAFSVSERTGRDVIAAAEARGYHVEILGRRTRIMRAREALLAAPAPRWDLADPGAGSW